VEISGIGWSGGWAVLALLFFGIIFFLFFMRRIEAGRIEKKFNAGRVIITSYGVNYFGLRSEKGGPARSTGALVLLKDGVYYRARFSKKELFIPAGAITSILIVGSHKGKPLYQHAVSIVFLNKQGKEDSAVFRMPFPGQWIEAIKMNLLNKRSE